MRSFVPDGPRTARTGLALALAASSGLAQAQWSPARMLHPDYGAAMAYDSARGRAVLFGSALGIAQTWEHDGVDWILRSTRHVPPTLGLAMAYDARRARVVVVVAGGTWEWDGDDWQERKPSTSPSTRQDAALAYDRARDRMVLFGGILGYTQTDETWEWDGTDWRQLKPASPPPPRSRCGMAYDAVRSRVVVFGGATTGYAAIGDTWEWDGARWTQRAPATSPPLTQGHGMVWDDARGRIVMFGGLAQTFGPIADTWEWDGTTWAQRLPASQPPIRAFAAMAFDRARGRVLLHGGAGLYTTYSLDDTWEWDGGNWSQRKAGFEPSMMPMGIAYDLTRDRTVMVLQSPSSVQTWERQGSQWVQRKPATSPGNAGPLVYDVARRGCVMFCTRSGAGTPGETWQWDGSNWLLRASGSGPSSRALHALAYDLGRARVVLFGGRDPASQPLSDTWEWDGSAWSQANPTSAPPRRFAHSMCYEPARGRVLLFGGNNGGPLPTSGLADTWEWDGALWTLRTPAAAPAPRAQHAMAHDWLRARTVLFSGSVGGFTVTNDTWEWDGNNWSQPALAGGPSVRTSPVMTYDLKRGYAVMIGGVVGYYGSRLLDTWTYGIPSPCAVNAYGSACAGTLGQPLLSAGTPFLGNAACTLDLVSARPAAACCFLLAASAQTQGLGGGCSLYLAQPIVALTAATGAGGFASLKLALPDDLTLVGASACAQACVLDPGGAYSGVALSRGLRLVLGY